MNAPASYMPPAARRQRDEANRLIKELNTPPAAAPNAAPVAGSDPGQVPDLPEINITPAAPASDQNAAPPADAVAPPPADKVDTKYKVLKGKYEAEVPRLRQQLDEKQEIINRLLLERQAPARPADPPRVLTPEERFSNVGVTAKEVQEYGPELLDMITRVAQGTMTPELRQLMADTQELKKSLGSVAALSAQTAQERMWLSLDQAVPNWRDLNVDDNFLAWLDQNDVFSGSSRRVALTSAFNGQDSARVVAIFKAYVGKTPTPTPSRSAPAVDRGTLVAPGQPRGGAMEAPDGDIKRILSEKEIGDFYVRVRKKQVSPEEYARVSAEIALAVAEGRVQPTHREIHQNVL